MRTIEPPWEYELRQLRAQLPFLPHSPLFESPLRYLALLNQAASDLCLRNARGMPIKFVNATNLSGMAYEPTIYGSGRVATRISGFAQADAWHDYFNAMMWLLWPLTKATINQYQVFAQTRVAERSANQRSAEQDRLTLIDESGLLVVCTAELAECFVLRQWQRLFVQERGAHEAGHFKVLVLGHGLMQKLAQPFKSITGQACVVIADDPQTVAADLALSAHVAIMANGKKPQPLPVMGLPYWHQTWMVGEQDEQFYNDASVFRL